MIPLPLLLYTFLILLQELHVHGCGTLPDSSVCLPILDYQDVYTPSCTIELESQLRANTYFLDLLSPSCRANLWYLTCFQTYPPCNTTSSQEVSLCEDSCLTFLSSCNNSEDSVTLNMLNASWIYSNCTGLPISNCYHPSRSAISLPRSSCVPYNGTVCKNFVNYPVLLKGGADYNTYINSVESKLSQLFETLSFASPNCSEAVVRFLCSYNYMPCGTKVVSSSANYSFNQEPPLPAPACLDVCENYITSCAALMPLFQSVGYFTNCNLTLIPKLGFGLTNVTCSGAIAPYIWDFQPEIYSYTYLPTIMGKPIQVQCNMAPGAANLSLVCRAPIVPAPPGDTGFVQTVSPGSLCEIPCPALYVWEDSEWNKAEGLMYATYPSFVLATFMLLTWLVFEKKRNQHFIFSFIVCIWMVAFVLIFAFAAVSTNPPSLRKLRYISCKNIVAGADMSTPSFCVFQAVILYVFLLSATCWWFLIVVDVFRRVTLETQFLPGDEKTNALIYHSFAWGFPILSLVIFLASGGKLGGSITNIFLFCFIYTFRSSGNPWITTAGDKWRDWLLWYGPIGMMGIIGFCLMSTVIAKIYYTTKKANVRSSRRELIGLHLRPLCFVLSFFLVFFWFFVWRVEYSAHEDEWSSSVQTWVKCIGENKKGVDCLAHPAARLDSWTWYGLHFFLSIQGIVLTLTWGTQMDNFSLWKRLIMNRCKRVKSSRTTDIEISKRSNSTRPSGSAKQPDEGDSTRQQIRPSGGFDPTSTGELEIDPSTEQLALESCKSVSQA